jgi:general secretion pathway protein D
MNLTQLRILVAGSLLPLSPLWLSAADTDATTPAQTAHQERLSREQYRIAANQSISDGQRFLASGQYDDAAKRFQYALDALTPGGTDAASYNRAEVGMAEAKAGQAKALAKDNKYSQADQLLEQAVVLQPSNPVYPEDIEELKREQMAYEAAVRDPEGTTVNPAVTDEFKGRVATVQKLLFQGDAYFRTGQYDKSEETYSKILLLDPYNKAARDKMDHIERYRERADSFRHEQYEAEAMEQVNHKWSEDISPDIVSSGTQTAVTTISQSNRVLITRKLNSIIIDKVNFEKLDIAAVIQFLQSKSKELDPDHQGINFVLRLTADTPVPAETAPGAAPAPPPAGAPAPSAPPTIRREVSITLENVPLSDVLNYITQQTNLKFSVEDYAVYLRPSIDEGETLTVRTFLVPPNFFEGSSLHVTVGATTDQTPTNVESISQSAQQALVDKGIRFPPGATAVFLPGSSKLVVRNTPEQLDLISSLVEQQSKETPQVQIEAKIAEFTQEALKSLSFNYVFGGGALTAGGTVTISTPVAVNTSLRTAADTTPTGLGGITPDGISELIAENPASTGGLTYASPFNPVQPTPVAQNNPTTLNIGAIIDNVGLAAVINALNNLSGVSLLSAPSITTQNGLKANIDIVREFPYPTSFEKPKLSNSSNLAYTTGPFSTGEFETTGVLPSALTLAVPPTPREFVTQDVGVSLEVKPTTYPDNRIDLDITKAQVLDFDGFIDYGVPIRERSNEIEPAADEEGTILTLGTINQPVFNLRSIVTNLQVLDGQTAVLGGLLREDTQEVNDKVPVLGDLPLIGRLFQSKSTDRTKKNLLMFITARLIKSNGKPQYVQAAESEPEEQPLPEPDLNISTPNVPLPEGTPNS